MEVNIAPNNKVSFGFRTGSIEYLPGEGIDITENVISIDETVATKEWVNDQGYLTEHQSLEAYRTSADQDIIDATKASNAALQAEAQSRASADTTLQANINNKQDKLTAGTNIIIDEDNVISATGTTAVAWGNLTGNLNSQTDLKQALDLKANLSDIPTKTSDLTNDSGFLTEHQSLEGYATEEWVEDQGYLTEHQSLAAYRTSAAQDIIDAGKQDKLTAGANITISANNVISATGGGSGSDIFWCTPNQTTYNEIIAAVNAGKVPMFFTTDLVYRGKQLFTFANQDLGYATGKPILFVSNWFRMGNPANQLSEMIYRVNQDNSWSRSWMNIKNPDITVDTNTVQTITANKYFGHIYMGTPDDYSTHLYDGGLTVYSDDSDEITTTYQAGYLTMNNIGSQYTVTLPTSAGKLALESKNTYQTIAPTSAISDGGIHIVFLNAEPTTKYAGYIYLIAED